MAPRLIRLVCPECHRHLADVPPHAEAWCPDCRRWVTASPPPAGRMTHADPTGGSSPTEITTTGA